MSDAKLSLASCLLKRRAIVDLCGVPWSEAIVGEDSNRKPCYRPKEESGKKIEFNVSHHGSLVVIVACEGDSTKLGVDVVGINWEKDISTVRKNGFKAFARTYEAVFSDREMDDIVNFETETTLSRDDEVRECLRTLYSHWSLKEAYVKMTGEALIAPWLRSQECKRVKAPQTADQIGRKSADWGEVVDDIEIWFCGERVNDIRMQIQSYKNASLVASAVSNRSTRLCPFKMLDLERDILS